MKNVNEKLEEKQENMRVDSVNSEKKKKFVSDVWAQKKKLSQKTVKNY